MANCMFNIIKTNYTLKELDKLSDQDSQKLMDDTLKKCQDLNKPPTPSKPFYKRPEFYIISGSILSIIIIFLIVLYFMKTRK